MRIWLTLVCVAAAAACVRKLPDQDLRILTSPPSAKLGASDLWKDFESDPRGAASRYFGRAIDVSDTPTAIEPQAPGGARMLFAQGSDHAVIARLLDERTDATLKDAKAGSRLTLRCFCEGRTDRGDILLKSCIRP